MSKFIRIGIGAPLSPIIVLGAVLFSFLMIGCGSGGNGGGGSGSGGSGGSGSGGNGGGTVPAPVSTATNENVGCKYYNGVSGISGITTITSTDSVSDICNGTGGLCGYSNTLMDIPRSQSVDDETEKVDSAFWTYLTTLLDDNLCVRNGNHQACLKIIDGFRSHGGTVGASSSFHLIGQALDFNIEVSTVGPTVSKIATYLKCPQTTDLSKNHYSLVTIFDSEQIGSNNASIPLKYQCLGSGIDPSYNCLVKSAYDLLNKISTDAKIRYGGVFQFSACGQGDVYDYNHIDFAHNTRRMFSVDDGYSKLFAHHQKGRITGYTGQRIGNVDRTPDFSSTLSVANFNDGGDGDGLADEATLLVDTSSTTDACYFGKGSALDSMLYSQQCDDSNYHCDAHTLENPRIVRVDDKYNMAVNIKGMANKSGITLSNGAGCTKYGGKKFPFKIKFTTSSGDTGEVENNMYKLCAACRGDIISKGSIRFEERYYNSNCTDIDSDSDQVSQCAKYSIRIDPCKAVGLTATLSHSQIGTTGKYRILSKGMSTLSSTVLRASPGSNNYYIYITSNSGVSIITYPFGDSCEDYDGMERKIRLDVKSGTESIASSMISVCVPRR